MPPPKIAILGELESRVPAASDDKCRDRALLSTTWWQEGIVDQIEQVSTEQAVAMALRLAREDGLFAGTSTGGNVVGALRLAEQLGPQATIVTVMCDTGMKYLRTYGARLG